MTAYNLDNYLSQPILVVGAGSIGERHIRNLWTIGFRHIMVYRQRNLPFRDIGDAQVKVILNWSEVEVIKPFAAIITSPTALHLQQAIACAQLGCHLLIEKPLSHTAEGLTQLKQIVTDQKIYLRVAYMLRFHPLIKTIKQYITNNTFGSLLSITDKWGDYLPDWHPWEDYRESYAARKELGGGVALTLSHDIDLMNWLANDEVQQFYTIKNYRSKLETSVESGCDVLLKYRNGITANVHLNFFEQTPERYMKLVFDKASLSFEYFKNTLTIKYPDRTEEIIEATGFDRNDMFIEQSLFFFSQLEHFTTNDSLQQIEESAVIINICQHE